jgi:hypothetical protein
LYFYEQIPIILLFLFLYGASAFIIAETARLRKQEHIFINDDSVSSAGILMRKEQIAILALAVWLTLIAIFMLLAQSIDIEIFFVLSLIGFLVIVELIAPKYVQPGYLRYIRYLLAVALVIFGVIVVRKVMEILAQ